MATTYGKLTSQNTGQLMPKSNKHAHIEQTVVGVLHAPKLTCTICGAAVVQDQWLSEADWKFTQTRFLEMHADIESCKQHAADWVRLGYK